MLTDWLFLRSVRAVRWNSLFLVFTRIWTRLSPRQTRSWGLRGSSSVYGAAGSPTGSSNTNTPLHPTHTHADRIWVLRTWRCCCIHSAAREPVPRWFCVACASDDSASTGSSMSSRKISSESFSSMGSDYLESPGEDGECPFSRVFWNGKSPVETLSCPFEDAAVSRRLARRKRVNLDSLGESLRRLTSPTVPRLTLKPYIQFNIYVCVFICKNR